MKYLSICVLFLLVGCSGTGLHQVEGEITLDGEPIPFGYIIFFGESGNGLEGGARIAEGRYIGEVASGKNLVKAKGYVKSDKPLPVPNQPGEFTTKKQITSDELHWDNPDLLLDMTGPRIDIHLTSDSSRK